MQLEVKVEDLRKKKLFVATPMYGGSAHGMYVKSCLDLQAVCSQYGIEVRFSFIFNESLITRARNYLVDEFLRAEGFTHLLFIDADIHFDPRDVIALLALDKEVVGGPYPKKSIKWSAVKDAVKKNPDIEAKDMEKVAGDFVFNPAPGTEKFSVAEPIEVLEIGTGFMLVARLRMLIRNFVTSQITLAKPISMAHVISTHTLIQLSTARKTVASAQIVTCLKTTCSASGGVVSAVKYGCAHG
jgi:hypothetical protein